MILKPLHDLVLVTPTKEVEGKTTSGLYIPETAKRLGRLARGVVKSVGPGINGVVPNLKSGQVVLYNAAAPIPVGTTEEPELLMRYHDIFAVEEPDFFVQNVKFQGSADMVSAGS